MTRTRFPGGPLPATVLGHPRIGRNRAMKKAIEAYWRGELSGYNLERTVVAQRREVFETLQAAGLTDVPCNDFSLYDQVLDTICLVGAVPERHRAVTDGLERYFAMARGTAGVAPLEMTKWFDTNYHYLVPELRPDTTFTLDLSKPRREYQQARTLGLDARPVLVGPVTFLRLAKPAPGVDPDFDPMSLLEELLPVYEQALTELAAEGVSWVQLDEPVLAQDQPPTVLDALATAIDRLGTLENRPKLLLATYFGVVREAMPLLRDAPVEGIALDLTGPGAANVGELDAVGGLPGKRLVAGVVDGRNVWAADLRRQLGLLTTLSGLADEIVVSSSCSLLHVPLDVSLETDLAPDVRSWFAFARQKLDEVVLLARGITAGPATIADELDRNQQVLENRRASAMTNDPRVRERAAQVSAADAQRAHPYPERAARQAERLNLPDLPTTTIGSFPQTRALRRARANWRRGELSRPDYEQRMRAEVEHVIRLQETLGLDVLVHGEPERNDMVQYFAEQLAGFVSTRHGWVQSYGTRYVRPPVIVGDVSRPEPMTVAWTSYAQSLTDRPVKGMLTGPVTMLRWSFVRDDLPPAQTARQVALALRDEVADLEAAGTAVIQVDEPALREGLPLRASERDDYLRWATEAFRLATGGVRDDTQVHTHMCYAEFGEILAAVMDLDTDVISVEAARSHMSIAADLSGAGYPSGVGPGVYDIHSPRVPGREEITGLLLRALDHVPAGRLWVNPDCGLKTRDETEVKASLAHLVAAAKSLR
ncbi:5-methyltetrahydropteroyltriglutamate--homocysteine S-methyltransferase [Kineosporia sp. NBRC 101731]|uniref:5-methyltetrahydropteroyltriglutamate-- homocysteine S-methyltransferase n=1 Tax=Kineosporia sp. NBRC 101731 TaxID=3032199 RepID=UPI0024A1E2C7|nr:5-methyltetrahydropteroyltriglutamate--homocysteine S-methyltransferase [Kineosporia sp. NBRC 101731]GLY30424.1 5-methyltetrahydropteroyltriglutamate--homocysteine methyltransferase [Kineosporia sp. NBRC 101731]